MPPYFMINGIFLDCGSHWLLGSLSNAIVRIPLSSELRVLFSDDESSAESGDWHRDEMRATARFASLQWFGFL